MATNPGRKLARGEMAPRVAPVQTNAIGDPPVQRAARRGGRSLSLCFAKFNTINSTIPQTPHCGRPTRVRLKLSRFRVPVRRQAGQATDPPRSQACQSRCAFSSFDPALSPATHVVGSLADRARHFSRRSLAAFGGPLPRKVRQRAGKHKRKPLQSSFSVRSWLLDELQSHPSKLLFFAIPN